MKPYNLTEQKSDQIRTMFNRIAPSYDMLNHLLSLGIDRRWRRRVVGLLGRDNPHRVLDMATGTGDMAIAIARKVKGVAVTGADLSPQMLEVARTKINKCALTSRISLCTAQAEKMPFDDGSFDAATVAFGVRNFQDIPKGLEEFARVLQRAGKLYILEFSTPRNKIFGALYRFYFHRVLPFVGGVLSKDMHAYRYLPESVDEFPDVDSFMEMINHAGFKTSKPIPLTFGVAYIYIAEKI